MAALCLVRAALAWSWSEQPRTLNPSPLDLATVSADSRTPKKACDLCARDFIIVLATGRSGSTSLLETLNSLPGVMAPEPEGAFYILADITGTGMTDIQFADRALTEARVQVIPGSLMKGGEGLIRLSYATSLENIHEGIGRLKQWISSII